MEILRAGIYAVRIINHIALLSFGMGLAAHIRKFDPHLFYHRGKKK